MTPLEKTLKRSLKIGTHDYVVTLTPDALKITEKGHRLGLELAWKDLVNGETALAVALHASLGQFEQTASPTKPNRPRAKKPAPERTRSASRRKSPRR